MLFLNFPPTPTTITSSANQPVIGSSELFPETITDPVTLSRTKTKSPQTDGICERFHKTILDEFYRIAFRKKIYNTLDELQADLDTWMKEYNEERVHSGKFCFGKTPMQTFLDSVPLVKEEMLNKKPRRVN